MNGTVKTILFSSALCMTLLTTGCHKSPKEEYGSASFKLEGTVSAINSLKKVLPRKDMYELQGAAGRVGGALQAVPDLVSSPAGKAKAKQAYDSYIKDVATPVMSLQYDPAAMAKKLDEIKATIMEISKEVK